MRAGLYLSIIGLIAAGAVGGVATFIVHDGLLGGSKAAALPLPRPPQKISTSASRDWLQLAVQAGTTYILQSRRQAIDKGVKPVPADVRQLLARYFPAPLLQKVRYRVGQPAPASLPGLAFSLREEDAITLQNVVVFRDAKLAHDDVLWAHELKHVRQYQRWGITGFVRRYLQNRWQVEWAAYKTQFDYRRAVHPASHPHSQ